MIKSEVKIKTKINKIQLPEKVEKSLIKRGIDPRFEHMEEPANDMIEEGNQEPVSEVDTEPEKGEMEHD